MASMPSSSEAMVDAALTKKLLLHRHAKARINNDAVLTASELLRLFISEARQRAAVEAECEKEGDATASLGEEEMSIDGKTVSIRADHITKVAAELLMDFS